MARTLEIIFLVGSSLVGFAMGAPEGSSIRSTLQCSIQLIALAQNNVSSNTAHLATTLSAARLPVTARFH